VIAGSATSTLKKEAQLMRAHNINLPDGETIFVGIDMHQRQWRVTTRTGEVELTSASIPGDWQSLRHSLERYHGHPLEVVYEAGCFGYWLHDRLVEFGAQCIVTPPSLIPQESGNRVKTDKRDSRKLALLLAKGMLKRVYVPTPQEREQRAVARRRRQLIRERVRAQNRIKAELRFYGIRLPEITGRWSKLYVENLSRIRFSTRWQQESFESLLAQYEFFTKQIERQTRLLRSLSQTAEYRERVQILQSIPGVGLIAAMEMLLELQDVARFRRADQLAAYVGLTPAQHSSGDVVRMGRITRSGKNSLRGTLVEAAWRMVSKDSAMRKQYEQIKARAGVKRAIVAVARRLLLRARRMLLDGRAYVAQPVAA
jgi:transposase